MRRGKFRQIRWVKPTVQPVRRPAMPRAQLTDADAVARAIDLYGLPEIPGTTPVEEASELLQAAAEIEHGLMLLYLYAAYSLDTSLGSTVQGWQGRMIRIAIEEMAHLASVQNLLLAIRSEPYFDRENWVPNNTQPDDPNPIPFVLEPLSLDSLGKYVATEAPGLDVLLEHSPEIHDKVQQIVEQASELAGSPINRVGLIYAKLYWLFQSDDTSGTWSLPAEKFPPGRHLSDEDFEDPAQLVKFQTTLDEWFASNILVLPVLSREEGLKALHKIAEEGEGLAYEGDSHFVEFFEMHEALENFSAPAGQSVSHNVPTHPNTSDTPHGDLVFEAGRITATAARLWAKLLNVRYQMLVTELALAMGKEKSSLPITNPTGRAGLLFRANFTEMRLAIGRISRRLMTLRRKDDASDEMAGPPFELPLEALPSGSAAQWEGIKRLISESAALIGKIRHLQPPNEVPTSADLSLLAELEAKDRELLEGIAAFPDDSPVITPPPDTDANDLLQAMIGLLRRMRDEHNATLFHMGLRYEGVEHTLGDLFDENIPGNEDLALLLRLLSTAKSVRTPTAGEPLVDPYNPDNSVFLRILSNTPVRIGAMASRFSDADRELIRKWIESLSSDE